jgi:hypothetical protein
VIDAGPHPVRKYPPICRAVMPSEQCSDYAQNEAIWAIQVMLRGTGAW